MEDLQAKKAALEAEKATLNPDNSDDRFRLSILDNELQQVQAQIDDAGRLQRQAEEVAGIELPFDYDKMWDVLDANKEIRSLIRQTKEFLFAQHNDELAAQADSFQQQTDVLRQQLDAANQETAAQAAQLKQSNAERLQALDAQRDAESKRDAAVQQAEEATAERDAAKAHAASYKTQIDELEAQLTAFRSKKAASSTGGALKLTSTLAPETDEQRAERMKREKMEQLNRQLQSRGMAPLSVPPQHSTPSPSENTQTGQERFSEAASAPDAVAGQSADDSVPGAAEAVKRTEFEALKADIQTKFDQLDGIIAALSIRTGGALTADELKPAI